MNTGVLGNLIYLGLGIAIAGCVSTNYREPENIRKLESQINQSPIATRNRAESDFNFVHSVATQRNRGTLPNLPLPNSREVTNFDAQDESEAGETEISRASAVVKPDGACSIYFQGYLGKNSSEAFFKAGEVIKRYPCTGTLVKLRSNGGLIVSGIAIGILIRESGWDTVVWQKTNSITSCVSSCALAYLGGNRRFKGALFTLTQSGNIYFHQPSEQKDTRTLCHSDPKEYANLLLYEYFKYVMPESSLMLLGKVLNESCDTSNYAVTIHEELYSKIFNAHYDLEIERKFR